MKTKNVITQLLLLAMIVVVILHFNNHDKDVKKGLNSIYEEYLSVPDSAMKSVKLLSVRETHEQLILDSSDIQREWPDKKMFIVSPKVFKDTTINGQLHEIIWEKAPRDKINFFESIKPIK